MAWWRRHPVAAAAVIYVILALLMVGPGLLPGKTLSSSDYLWTAAPWHASQPADVRRGGANYELGDAVAQFQPFLRYTRARLPDIPLWNPYIMAGRPFLANAQSAVFSPFSVPAYVLPFWFSLGVIAALKLFVAALGTFLLARALGMRFGGALLAGIVFAFGTFFIVWLAWPLASVFAMIPWLLLLADMVVRRPQPLPVVGLAVVVAVQYTGGHPESSFHALFATCVFFAFRLLVPWRGAGRALARYGRPAIVFALALAAGTALAAVVLVPFIELLGHSSDVSLRLGAPAAHADARYLFALFLHDYWGRPTQTEIALFLINRAYYAGALTLMLAVAALLVRPRIERVAVAAFAAFSLLMVVGENPVFDLVVRLPGFDAADNGRMVILFLLCLALLAGWGLDALCEPAIGGSRRMAVLAASAVLFAVPIVVMAANGTIDLHRLGSGLRVAWGFARPPATLTPAVAGTIRMSALLQWLPLAGLGLALVALRLLPRRGLAVGAFVALSATLVAGDLFRANMGFNPAISTKAANPPATGAIRYLQARSPARFVGLDTTRPLQPLLANQAMTYGLYDARGYDYPVEKRFDRLWRSRIAPFVGTYLPATTLAQSTPQALRSLGLLGVADLLQDPADPPLHEAGVRLAYSGADARVYTNPLALPRVFVVDRQLTVDGGDAAYSAITATGFDPRAVAVTERRVAGVAASGGGASASGGGASAGVTQGAGRGPAAGTAKLLSYQPERVVVSATARRASLLVLDDTWFPGWQARVDGRPATVARVDYLLRGVEIPPGSHRVEFDYEPASWRVGWIISLVTLLGLATTTALALRARRRSTAS